MKSVAVIGQGFVGGSLTTVFTERGFDVYTYDKAGVRKPGGKPAYMHDLTDRGHERQGTEVQSVKGLVFAMQELGKTFSGVYFVCLPTPMLGNGDADLSIVEGVLKEMADVPGAARVVVIKSTVPPGTCERWNKAYNPYGLHIVFNPEFLREMSALDDMRNQDRIILGGPRPHINKVKQLFEAAFPNVPVKKTSSTTAEMVKYITNVHLAVKVSLANEFYQICEALDAKGANVDYDKCIEYATMDERLGKSHWKVPGPMPASDTGEPALGFAGSCFIKDLNALMAVARKLGIDPKTMSGAWEKNLEVRPQRDWEKLVGRAVSVKQAR
jgi:UDPglucose 6-dehydrogenase